MAGWKLMWAARLDEGFLFGGLDNMAISTLKGVPMLVESEDERVRRRLLPETCDDDDDEEQWRQHAVPELERLFLSRAQLVRRDLEGLKRLPGDGSGVLFIAHEHASAWLAALNAARLALFELNELEAADFEEGAIDRLEGKQREAALRMDLMAGMQAILIGDHELEEVGSVEDLVEFDEFEDPPEAEDLPDPGN